MMYMAQKRFLWKLLGFGPWSETVWTRHMRGTSGEHGAPGPEASSEVEGSNSKPQDESKPSAPPDEGLGAHYSSLFFGDEEDPLDPGDAAQLEEEAARYHGDDGPLPFAAFVDDCG